MKFRCAHCRKTKDKPSGEVNRARAAGRNLYCNRRCSGLGRRGNKTTAQKREEKRLYDIAYRAENLADLLERKREYHKRTYDPVRAAEVRKKRMPLHVEYCRQPEYRRWKKTYDRQYRAKKDYGPFAEAAMLAVDLNREIKGRVTNEQIAHEKGTQNKKQSRSRLYRKDDKRERPRNRRADYSSTYG